MTIPHPSVHLRQEDQVSCMQSHTQEEEMLPLEQGVPTLLSFAQATH